MRKPTGLRGYVLYVQRSTMNRFDWKLLDRKLLYIVSDPGQSTVFRLGLTTFSDYSTSNPSVRTNYYTLTLLYIGNDFGF